VLELLTSGLTSQAVSNLVQALSEGGAFTRLSGRRTDRRSASRVAAAQQAVLAADELLLAAVAAERDRGVSWEAIGDALNITRSTAHGRFADRLEEASARQTDTEHALDLAWQRMLDLAEGHLTPLTHGIAELRPEARQQASRNLMAAVIEPSFPAETRIGAAQMVATMEPGKYSNAIERLLKEAAARSTSPDAAPVFPVDTGTVEDTVTPAWLVNHSAYDNRAFYELGDESRSELMNAAIQGLETVLEKITADGEDHSAQRLARERLAALLIIRFDERTNIDDLEQAIQNLRSTQADAFDPDAVESAHLLALALGRQYDQYHNPASLAEAVALFNSVVSFKERVYGADHPEAFQARFDLAQLLARSGDPGHASQMLEELRTDQVRVLGADHPDVLQTQGAYALSLSETGNYARAEQLLADLVTRQARVLGAGHHITVTARAQLLKIMAARLTRAADAELIEQVNLEAWSMLAHALTGNRGLPHLSTQGLGELPYSTGLSIAPTAAADLPR
jgi:Tetratricopeptide repeat